MKFSSTLQCWFLFFLRCSCLSADCCHFSFNINCAKLPVLILTLFLWKLCLYLRQTVLLQDAVMFPLVLALSWSCYDAFNFYLLRFYLYIFVLAIFYLLKKTNQEFVYALAILASYVPLSLPALPHHYHFVTIFSNCLFAFNTTWCGCLMSSGETNFFLWQAGIFLTEVSVSFGKWVIPLIFLLATLQRQSQRPLMESFRLLYIAL